jgi:hypothetical protein
VPHVGEERLKSARVIEKRLGDISKLIRAAIANAGSRAETRGLLEQQVTLRRVASKVPPDEIIPTVVDEIRRILGADAMIMTRLDPDGVMRISAQTGNHLSELAVGNRLELISEVSRSSAIAGWPRLLADHHEPPPPELVRHITRAVTESCNGEISDDATVVCLDWHPKQLQAQ